MTDSTDTGTPRSRRMLLLLVAMFFLPIAAAFVLYYGTGWRPAGGSNHGELLQPIRQLPADAAPLLGKWTLFYVGDGSCGEDCRHALWVARQTRLSVNRDMQADWSGAVRHTQLLRPGLPQQGTRGDPGVRHWRVRAEKPAAGPAAARRSRQRLVHRDPLGNIVMRFDARVDPHGLLDDLKKLLKLSHIG